MFYYISIKFLSFVAKSKKSVSFNLKKPHNNKIIQIDFDLLR